MCSVYVLYYTMCDFEHSILLLLRFNLVAYCSEIEHTRKLTESFHVQIWLES